LREWDDRRHEVSGRTLRTLYFGGGTPGLWSTDAIGSVISAVADVADAPLREVTIELNPERTDASLLDRLRSVGVTRVSLGVQSFDDATLKALGRLHDGATARAAVHRVVEAGFSHVSVDLIVGAPGIDSSVPVRDAEAVVSIAGVDHVSTYDLTWEPGTAFAARRARGRVHAWTDDALADASDTVDQTLAAGGFVAYEVSNHARPGGRAIHNAAYWVGDEYVGLGVGAHSLEIGGRIRRRANGRHPSRYMHDPHADAEVELIEPRTHLAELVMTGLRTDAGIDLVELRRRFGPLAAVVDVWAERAEANGWVARQVGRLVATSHGRRFADDVALDAFDALCDSDSTCAEASGA
jgi:oxygen-independent coproporphyrinogen-3 oxidase